ncbi:hypothetical protein BV22DRAFT_1045365 [Leucogyrophana mollusca]|uniref:Uncharacterized protein n=1 Tax=Leucogyrophana mollusca TaxID=85980 RepID=A0ACB8BPM4_9AGAM|nr:hypothetical protein BV22DRAFT_1045365 [Leucogyrophana mollusca]
METVPLESGTTIIIPAFRIIGSKYLPGHPLMFMWFLSYAEINARGRPTLTHLLANVAANAIAKRVSPWLIFGYAVAQDRIFSSQNTSRVCFWAHNTRAVEFGEQRGLEENFRARDLEPQGRHIRGGRSSAVPEKASALKERGCPSTQAQASDLNLSLESRIGDCLPNVGDTRPTSTSPPSTLNAPSRVSDTDPGGDWRKCRQGID